MKSNFNLSIVAVFIFILAIGLYFKKKHDYLSKIQERVQNKVQKSNIFVPEATGNAKIAGNTANAVIENEESEESTKLEDQVPANHQEQQANQKTEEQLTEERSAIVMKCLDEKAEALGLQGSMPQDEIDECNRKIDLAPGQETSGSVSSYSATSG